MQATVYHHGPDMNSAHHNASINCRDKHFIATILNLWNAISVMNIFHQTDHRMSLSGPRRRGPDRHPCRWHNFSVHGIIFLDWVGQGVLS